MHQFRELEEEQKRLVLAFEKLDRESETDSEESYQGDIASLSE